MNSLQRNPVVLDVETTISNKGNPFDETNILITIQSKSKENVNVYHRSTFIDLVEHTSKASCIIGSNLKFDLNWLKRELNWTPQCPVWDLQIAEFLFSYQNWKYPDLDTMGVNYKLGSKIHGIKEKYWDQGIDTDQIPLIELEEYGKRDVELTYLIFLEQVKKFSTTEQDLFPLFRLQCNDLLVLQKMEYNGLIYDEEESLQTATKLELEIKAIEEKLNKILNNPGINYNSNDDISIILYGGTKEIITKEPIGFYKTGLKIGQIRYQNVKTNKVFPRLVTPLKGSELLKEGFYKTDEPTLRALVTKTYTKNIITLLLERSKLEKINGTYLKGLPKLREKMNWPPNKLYSTLNQCLAITGRLSSSKPNQQNLAPLAKQFCISRY